MNAINRESAFESRVAGHIEAIAASGDRFSSRDAEAIRRLLSGAPICRAAGFELAANPSSATIDDEPVLPSAADEVREVGSADCHCGPYVVTRTGVTAFIIRHEEDRHAFIHDDEEMLLAKKAGQWSACLNRPRPYNLGLFRLYLGRHFEPWKIGS